MGSSRSGASTRSGSRLPRTTNWPKADFGSVGSGPNQPTTFSMVPGIYVVCVPASNNCVLFSVTPGGTVDFEPALDGRLSGRGTATLFIGRRPVAPPPTVACVGTSGAPATLTAPANACGVAASGGTAGACASGNSGPVTCTFDGHAAETLGAGSHAVVVVATGSDGQSATCTSYVSIIDATPPSLTEGPTLATLSPPNHKLVPIDLHLVAGDNCALAGPPTCSVTSSEPPLVDGSGHTSVDIVWTADRLSLRAERSGRGTGPHVHHPLRGHGHERQRHVEGRHRHGAVSRLTGALDRCRYR